jgi:hypothetical protein
MSDCTCHLGNPPCSACTTGWEEEDNRLAAAIVGLSDAAFRLWIVGLTYCNQQANDGRFSAASRIPNL